VLKSLSDLWDDDDDDFMMHLRGGPSLLLASLETLGIIITIIIIIIIRAIWVDPAFRPIQGEKARESEISFEFI
jgi:hypothetical protein